MGNAVVTIRALPRTRWVEVTVRRVSGLMRILAWIESMPMVGPGEVDPNLVSVPAMLSMDHKSLGEENELYQVGTFPSLLSRRAASPLVFFAVGYCLNILPPPKWKSQKRHLLPDQIPSLVTSGDDPRLLNGGKKLPLICPFSRCSCHSMGARSVK